MRQGGAVAEEMRVSALGTRMPNARMSQAGSCWLVEFGNGGKFFFDLGLGCIEKFSVLGIPYGAANEVFLSHLSRSVRALSESVAVLFEGRR